MISCIAIDDEPKALEVMERYCRKTNLVTLKATFREPVKAIEFLQREKMELVFLDINMPDINGIALLQTLPYKPLIIFTTAYSHYAVESYELNALDYLLKPITFERFLVALNKAVTAFSPEEKTMFFKSGPQTHQVKVADILYFEKDGNYIMIHLKDKQILIRENMADLFDLVPVAGFLRVHKSYVVAVTHIVMVEVHQLIVGTQKIPIGSSYRESVKTVLGN